MKRQDIQLDMVNEECVNFIHDRMLTLYGGLPGVRDENALGSAIKRSRMRQYYDELADLFDLAAESGYGIIRNHAFNDANKRTGAVLSLTILRVNGYDIDEKRVSNEQLIELFQDVAADKTDSAELAAFFRKNTVQMTSENHLQDTAALKAHLFRGLSSR